jgi:hypothetical protein
MLSADQVAAKWAQNTGSAVQAYTDGVNAVTVAPGQAAARAVDLWAQNVAAAKSKYQANSAKVSLADWQASATGKGAARLASGVQAAQPKMQQAMTKLLPYIAQQVNALPARGNLDQNINRMTAFVRGMAKYTQS